MVEPVRYSTRAVPAVTAARLDEIQKPVTRVGSDSRAAAKACPHARLNECCGHSRRRPRATATSAITAPLWTTAHSPCAPQAVVVGYLLAALRLLIPLGRSRLDVRGEPYSGGADCGRTGAAVIGLGVACMVFGVEALR